MNFTSDENSKHWKRIKLFINSRNYLKVCTIIKTHGGTARLVGGSVRDALLSILSKDIDIATDLLPEKIEDIFKKEGYKVVPTGKSFGTISIFIADENRCKYEAFEITTLRKDIKTDGRRALVEYCKDYFQDALRRDFTINALSYDPLEEKLYDYFNGENDLKNNRVRFIGDPKERIQEDYLRILRFFRFIGRFVNFELKSLDGSDSNFEFKPCRFKEYLVEGLSDNYVGSIGSEDLNACVELSSGIRLLSRERIKSEIDLILLGKNASYTLHIMVEYGILSHIFDGVKFDPKDIFLLEKISKDKNIDISKFKSTTNIYYAIIFSNSKISTKYLIDLKFSSKEASCIKDLVKFRNDILLIITKNNQTVSGSASEVRLSFQRFLIIKWLYDKEYEQFFLFSCLCLYEAILINKNLQIILEENSVITSADNTDSSIDLLKQCSNYLLGIYEKLELKLIKNKSKPKFPLKGESLMKLGYKGAELGIILNELHEAWIDSFLSLTAEELTNMINAKNED